MNIIWTIESSGESYEEFIGCNKEQLHVKGTEEREERRQLGGGGVPGTFQRNY